MRPIRKRIWILTLAGAIVFGAAFYDHQTYFFNPLTFRNNRVVYLPFDQYKNPMQIQVWGQRAPSSAQLIYTTFDENQIRFVFRALESGSVIDSSRFKSFSTFYVHITIRSGSHPDSSIVQDALLTGPNFDVAKIYTQVPGRAFSEYITVPAKLKKWALSSFQKGIPIH